MVYVGFVRSEVLDTIISDTNRRKVVGFLPNFHETFDDKSSIKND